MIRSQSASWGVAMTLCRACRVVADGDVNEPERVDGRRAEQFRAVDASGMSTARENLDDRFGRFHGFLSTSARCG